MKKTFVCDDTMIITIPIGSLNDSSDGQLMPQKFHCVYKDSYKVFATRGKPKPLGTKLSFSMNIISLFWSIIAIVFLCLPPHLLKLSSQLGGGIQCLIMTLLVVEKLLALFLIYWLSKAVCRQHFNTLPIILLKQGD
uniref:Uncharacterized protein n=1 Tax=Labrus bergylta TaxID=56723 RepID=A0A3Q3E1W1_9LABR